MPTTTTNYAFRKPVSADAADLVTIVGNLADDVDAGLLAQLNKIGKGIIAWGNRPSTSSGTTTEIGVLRIDNIPIVNGRAYRIWTGPLALYSNVTNDVVIARLRVNTAGVATTASGAVGQPLQAAISAADTSFPGSRPYNAIYNAVTTGSLSVLLTIGRTTGTGTASIQNGCDLIVEDIGLAQADTGVDI